MTWAIILCRFRDVAATQPVADMQKLFTSAGQGTGGLFDYWQAMSFGRFQDNSVVYGWYDIPHDSSEISSGLSRSTYQQWAVDAANANGVPIGNYTKRIFFFNANGDHGATGAGTTVFSYAPQRALEPTFIFHETGHTLGLDHSFSDGTAGCCGSSTAGEYCDPWDIMSAMCVFNYYDGTTGLSGPGLCAPSRDRLGWLDPARVFSNWSSGSSSVEIDLAPLSEPGRNGYLAARMDDTCLIEYRIKTGFDQGIPNAAVLVHWKDDLNSTGVRVQTLLDQGGKPPANRPNKDFQVGDEYVLYFVKPFTMKVISIDPAGTARIRLTRNGLGPYWMNQGRIDGTGMHWSRGNDFFVAADVDGDKSQEILVANNDSTYIGLLKWNGQALAPVWIVGGRIDGVNMHWSRGTDAIYAADVDGDGRSELLIVNNSNTSIGILKWNGSGLGPIWIGANRLDGTNMHWSRGNDQFVIADVDGDGHDEVVIFNNDNGSIGLLRWAAGSLVPVWIVSNGRLDGINMHWNRGLDLIVAADVDGDGHKELLIANNSNGAIGVLKWNGAGLEPVWIVPTGRLDGVGMHWNRGTDFFAAADVDADGSTEIVVGNASSNYYGLLKWDGAAMTPVFVASMDGLAGVAFDKFASVIVADIDGTRKQRLIIPNGKQTAIGRWNAGVIDAEWFALYELVGTVGSWFRNSNDVIIPVDVDGNGRTDIFIANRNGWSAVMKWDPNP